MTKPHFSILTRIACIALLLICACNINDNDDDTPQISLFDLNKEIIETNVTNTSTGLGSVFTSMVTDSVGRAELSQAFVSRGLFFPDESGYFFIETLDSAWVIAHLNESYIGTSRYYAQDLNGKYHVQEVIDTVLTSGSGFVEYFFTNPATQNGENKLSFVTQLFPTNWFIGAGFYYTDDEKNTLYDVPEGNKLLVEDLVTTYAKGISGVFTDIYTDEAEQVAFCRTFLDDITFFEDESGYFFILDFDGLSIAHGAQQELEGQNQWDLQDTKGTFIVRDMAELAQNNPAGEFYEYYWMNPATEKEEPKTSFVMRIPNTSYFIGAGVYQE